MRLQLLALSCLSLFVSSLAQAPLDAQTYCLTNSRFSDEHNFPNNVKLLLDSHQYQNLVDDSSPVWKRGDFDQDGGQWTQRGGICQYDLRACSYSQGPQDNWIFTQFVSYLDPMVQEIFVNITFRFSQCTSNPACTNDFVNVYRYDTGAIDTVGQTDKSKYKQKVGVLQQVGSTDNDVHWTFKRPQDASIKGFYMGFEDIGTCGQMKRILVYHKKDSGYRDESKLVTCPTIPLPSVGSGEKFTKDCVCDANSAPITNLGRSCDELGVCTGGQECACKPGYELNEAGSCEVCPPGKFKAGVSNTEKCSPCPLNSKSIFEGAAVCTCDCNTVRPPNTPSADCKRPPSSPLIANDNTPTFEDTSVTIYWLPATDDGGSSDTLHYNVYTYDTASKVYKKVNQAEIKHKSDLISYTLPIATSMQVVVTSATSATGDEETIRDLSDVQNRFIILYILGNSVGNIELPVIDNVVDQVVPEVVVVQPQIPALHFELGSNVYIDGSTVSLSDIGEEDAALLCKTNNVNCCKSNFEGEFYYPNGNVVPVRALGHPVYRNRGDGFIRLNYYGSGGQTGLYRCEVPDSAGVMQSISINIV